MIGGIQVVPSSNRLLLRIKISPVSHEIPNSVAILTNLNPVGDCTWGIKTIDLCFRIFRLVLNPTHQNHLRWSLNLLLHSSFFIHNGSNQTLCRIHSCCCHGHRTSCCPTCSRPNSKSRLCSRESTYTGTSAGSCPTASGSAYHDDSEVTQRIFASKASDSDSGWHSKSQTHWHTWSVSSMIIDHLWLCHRYL